MNYADIKQYDVANGPGIRVSLFVSGCNHACKGCFNEVAWDFNYGNPFTEVNINQIIEYMAPSYVEGITILGGEPMEPSNQAGILPLLRKIKEIYPEKTIWLFTGFLFDKNILDQMVNTVPETKEILSYLDVMVDGPFILEQKDLTLYFKGSSNQRTILVQESLKANKIILWEPQPL